MSTTVLDRPPEAPATARPVLDPPACTPVPAARPRLSTLMREGAKMHPQGRGALYRLGHTCALGAVAMAILGPKGAFYLGNPGGLRSSALSDMVYERTGVDLSMAVRAPGEGRAEPLSAAIVRLNDGAKWSREAIATWLQSLGL